MNHNQIISGLKQIAISCADARKHLSDKRTLRNIKRHHDIVVAAADLIMQLRWRLCTQAMELERAEAAVDAEPDYWPLLDPDDDDPGAAL